MNNTRIRLGEILKEDRESKGISRDKLASKTGFSSATIKNWEHGYSSPDIPELVTFYKEIGMNPSKAINAIIYPDMDGLTGADDDESVDKAFNAMFGDLSITEKRHLLFMKSSYHGSDWMSLLQMITAHLHTPLAARYAVAQLIATHYKLTEATGSIVCEDNIRPNMDLLEKAIEMGQKAAFDGLNAYTIGGDL